MRGLMILLLLFLSGWLLESASTDRDSFLVQGASREALRAGRQLLQQNRWSEGVQKAKEALELYPGNREAASILVEVGLSLRDAGVPLISSPWSCMEAKVQMLNGM